MIPLIITIAVVGFIVWLIVTLIPMPEPFPKVIIAIACLLLLVYVLQGLGVWSGGLRISGFK